MWGGVYPYTCPLLFFSPLKLTLPGIPTPRPLPPPTRELGPHRSPSWYCSETLDLTHWETYVCRGTAKYCGGVATAAYKGRVLTPDIATGLC